MFRPTAVYIGLRNVRAKRHKSFISFISLISMLGLILGVSVLITVLSVMNGFEEQMKIKILGVVPHAVLLSPERMPDWQNLAYKMQQQDSNIIATAPFNRTQGMITSNTGKVSSVMLSGIIPEYERNVSVIDKEMIDGSFDSLNSLQNNLIIGKKLAETMKVKVGDEVNIILPEGTTSGAGIKPNYFQFKITGIYRLSPDAEKILVYAPMEVMNTVLKQPKGAEGIRLKLNNVFNAKDSADMALSLNPSMTALNWTRTNGDMFKVIRMQKAMVALILAFIILVASFNLVSSLIMVVTEKKSEIAILKTFGASRSQVVKIFITQGFIISAVGTLIGGALGIGLALTIGDISNWVNTTFKLDLFANYYVTQLPSNPRVGEIILVMLSSAVIGVVATIYPAFKAANIQPVQALRNE